MKPTGVEIRGLYDGVAYWTVPGYNWHRWPFGSPIYQRVEEWAIKNGVVMHDAPPDGLEGDE